MSVPVRTVVTRAVTRMFMIAVMTMTRLPHPPAQHRAGAAPHHGREHARLVITSMAMIGRET